MGVSSHDARHSYRARPIWRGLGVRGGGRHNRGTYNRTVGVGTSGGSPDASPSTPPPDPVEFYKPDPHAGFYSPNMGPLLPFPHFPPFSLSIPR